ncbi:MAG: ABC transporter ATP-binding protein [Paludibacteraceae bacterium]|nr:ABC transporter ATP-binding protein [Paludibacteraceae bacterium]
MLLVSHLDIGYPGHRVQHDLRLSASEGMLIGLIGQNGCGKSTLLRTLSGLQPALGGEIAIRQKSLDSLDENERARTMALVLTEKLSLEATTVTEVVAMGRYPYTSVLGKLTGNDRLIVRQALEKVGLADLASRPYNSLSDGEKQRVLIAKALAQQTPLILLDEPTAHLDLPSRIQTMLLLRELAHDEHKCVIISTHELELALKTADTLWLMTADGVEVGEPAEIKDAVNKAFRLDDLGYLL